ISNESSFSLAEILWENWRRINRLPINCFLLVFRCKDGSLGNDKTHTQSHGKSAASMLACMHALCVHDLL
ncbi:hypothetical protein BLOT_000237, partial [Blomia tropicalis]